MSADLSDLAARWADRALPGEQLEVAVGRTLSTSVKAYGGEIEAFSSAESFGVGIRVLIEGRQGFAHAGSFDDDVVAEVLREARDNARFAERDPWAGLAEPDGVAPVVAELWDPAVLAFSADQKIALALDVEARIRAADPRIKGVEAAVFGDSAGEMAIASTTGIRTASRATTCYLSASALAGDEAETQTGYGVDVGRDPNKLDITKVVDKAVETSTRLLGARQVPSQRLAVVLEARLAATLLGVIGGTLTGDVVVKGRSPFSDRVGEQVASPLLTFVDDPTDPRSLGADTFDGEGLACRRNVLIQEGVLAGFLHNSYTARRMGTASSGSAVRGSRSLPSVGTQAMAITPGARTMDQLLAGVGEGFFLQSMKGLHSGVNPISGDFSVGAEGLMIRGGALAEPVREVTIASTLQRLLLDLVEVGSELEWLPSGTGCAPLVIGEISLSGS